MWGKILLGCLGAKLVGDAMEMDKHTETCYWCKERVCPMIEGNHYKYICSCGKVWVRPR